ncbi:MAG: peptidase T [Allobaculum sp.]|nr:peptidase T [Allobaculum sp.]
MNVVDKFLKYISFDTQSDASSITSPSTSKQLNLANELVKELHALGVTNAEVDPYGIVYATLEANEAGKDLPSIGLIAHMDTASEMSGANVNPQIVYHYDGGTIQLNERVFMNPTRFPELLNVIGDDLIVTDGTTLLGADDKAGIAIIMDTVERLLNHNLPHGNVYIAFTPDEEIGRGVENFDLSRFPADFAYTLDGTDIDSVDYETFNAAQAVVTFHGRSIHPGVAKGRMINAAAAAVHFAASLPQAQRPEFTEGREGFLHLISMEGECEYARLEYLIRDHDRTLFEQKKELLKSAAAFTNTLYEECCDLEITDRYYNMKDYLHGDMEAVDKAKAALKSFGVNPISTPIRGGTDGAMLTVKGLITPNLGTGGANCHGRYEFVSINKMQQMVDVICKILEG